MSGNGSGQGQGGTFGRSQGFNPQSLGGMPGMNNAMQRFAPQYGSAPQGFGGGQMPTNMAPQREMPWQPTTNYRPGFTPPPVDPAMIYGNLPASPTTNRDGSPYQQQPPTYSAPTTMQDPMQPPMSQRYGVPSSPPPQMPTLNPYGTQPTQEQLAAHMAQRNNITNGTVMPGARPTPDQLKAHLAANAAYTTGYGSNTPVPLPPWLR